VGSCAQHHAESIVAVNSRRKGARGERQLRDELKALGYADVYRTAQRSGRGGMPDLEGIPGVHIECKVGKNIDVWKAMAQAVGDMEDGRTPVVLARKDRHETLLVCKLKDLHQVINRMGREDKND